MSILQAFSIKNIFYDKMNLRLYFCVKTYSTPKCLTCILINELLVSSYELLPLRVVFFALVTSYELLFIARITSYLLHTRVTSYILLHELRVIVCMRVTSYCLLHELRVTFSMRVMSYRLLYELRF